MKQLLFILLPAFILASIFTQNQKLSKTLNLGNYLEAPNEGEWGEKLTEDDFVNIANKGFTAVRIPARWSNHLSSSNQIDSVFLNRVSWAVRQANQNGLVAIIDDHHFDSLMTNPDEFESVSESIWQQIATHFQSIPDHLLFFEPINEPHTNLSAMRWNTLHQKLTAIIRETNPTRPVIIGTTGWGGIAGLYDLVLGNDTNIIVTVHYYQPMEFTHQGASWVTNANEWLGTEWNATFYEKRTIQNDIKAVKSWSVEKNIPIFVGEFGAYSKADISSREKWTHYCARLFESVDFSWAYWEYSSGFGLYNPENSEWRDGLLDTLLSTDTSTLILDSVGIVFGEELVSNSDFSNGSIQWFHNVFGGADATLNTLVEGATHTAHTLGEESYNIQLLQYGINLQAGKRYILSAELKGNDTTKASLGLMRSDFSTVVSLNPQVIKSSGTSLELIVTPQLNEGNITLSLTMGYDLGKLQISNVSLRELNPTSLKSTKKIVLQPWGVRNENKVLHFTRALQANHIVKLYSLRGQHLLTQIGSGGNQIAVPETTATGWYAVTVSEQGRELLRTSVIIK